MSVLIKGMEMPKDCRECPMMDYGTMTGETYCKVNGKTLAKSYRSIEFDGRPDWCPMVELPDKHGRLVDTDDIKARMIPLSFSVQKWISEVELSNCRTVVKAEGET